MNESIETNPQNQPHSGKMFDNYSPVDVEVREVTGSLFLGILAIILLILFVRSNNRYLELLRQIKMS